MSPLVRLARLIANPQDVPRMRQRTGPPYVCVDRPMAGSGPSARKPPRHASPRRPLRIPTRRLDQVPRPRQVCLSSEPLAKHPLFPPVSFGFVPPRSVIPSRRKRGDECPRRVPRSKTRYQAPETRWCTFLSGSPLRLSAAVLCRSRFFTSYRLQAALPAVLTCGWQICPGRLAHASHRVGAQGRLPAAA